MKIKESVVEGTNAYAIDWETGVSKNTMRKYIDTVAIATRLERSEKVPYWTIQVSAGRVDEAGYLNCMVMMERLRDKYSKRVCPPAPTGEISPSGVMVQAKPKSTSLKTSQMEHYGVCQCQDNVAVLLGGIY